MFFFLSLAWKIILENYKDYEMAWKRIYFKTSLLEIHLFEKNMSIEKSSCHIRNSWEGSNLSYEIGLEITLVCYIRVKKFS